MKLLFYIHHPAQFHLFKNVISKLKNDHSIIILATKKDILEDLLNDYGLEFINVLPKGRKNSKISIAWSLIKQDYLLLKVCLKQKPDLLIGTSTEITNIGKLLNIDSIFVNEDDVEVIPLVEKLAYPFAKHILVPDVCSTGKWQYKTINHYSYHELAYLHPDHFRPDIKVVEKYLNSKLPYFIIRFAQFGAHHDTGINGIHDEIGYKLINILKPFGQIIITSERRIPSEMEQYRISVSPLDMHHLLAFSSLYVGDSQTMAAEAGALGVPFIRFNDFVGRIGYLNDIENNYKLGYGIKSKDVNGFFDRLTDLLNTQNLKDSFQEKRKKMLGDKINLASFLVWFIHEYPSSVEIMKSNPEYQYTFK